MASNKEKIAVVGGSNGIGLAVAKEFIGRGYYAEILDMVQPDASMDEFDGEYSYRYCDLTDFDEELFCSLAEDDSVTALMITAGFGHAAEFENLHISQIQKLIDVNTAAGLKIVRLFYERLKSRKSFLCGMMGSIAGLVSSPLFSVYAASKAAVCRFAQSVNIELEMSGTDNRILNVSPGSIKGTRFNSGSENCPELTQDLARQIADKLETHCELFIPDYDKTYGDVIERYRSDPHAFGLSSYQYKLKSGRVFNDKRAVIGYLSGTFDLFHVGHLNLIQRAKSQCDYLIVGVHPDASHKGKETFIPFDERMRIVGAVKYVDKVVTACPEDTQAWEKWRYSRLFVGSDYKGTPRFNRYEEFFSDKDVEIIYFPYTKQTNSTQIRKTVLLKTNDVKLD